MRRTRKRAQHPGGATTVETAFVLPAYIVLLFAIIEFGHAQMVVSLLQSGCRNGARMGAMQGPTTAEVVARVKQTLGAAVNVNAASVVVKNAGVFDSGGDAPSTDAGIEALPAIELSEAEPRQMFVVRASVPYNSIALVPMPFLHGVVLDAQAFMRHE